MLPKIVEDLAMRELVWVPEHGIGHYPVEAQPYNDAYWDRYRKWDWTVVGDQLNAARVGMVTRHTKAAHEIVCDVGIGGGRFVTEIAKALPSATVRGFDVNPAAVTWLSDTGFFIDPYAGPVASATFWDSLEHIHEPGPLLANVRKFAFVSIPIFKDAEHIKASKHFRKDEHVWYFTRAGFIWFMRQHGFSLLEVNTMEQECEREDIESFAFERVA